MLLSFITFAASAQQINGSWAGTLKVQSASLRLVFHISKTETGYTAVMDSPDQGAYGLPAGNVTFTNPSLLIEAPAMGISYKGELKNDHITGEFKQGGQKFNVDLYRTQAQKPEERKRPQEPSEPYPYYTEEVVFKNVKEGIELSGTLSLPKKEGMFPVAILISGSGPQNRDEELMGHKPFLVLSDYLVRRGIGVLRYDDRGTAKSGGVFKTAVTADFAQDALSAVEYLKTRKEVNKNKIGLIGHSEGGLIAPIVANKSKKTAFIVLMAGPAISGDQLLLTQQVYIGKALGKSEAEIQKSKSENEKAFEIVKKYSDPAELKANMIRYITEISQNDPAKPEGISQKDYVEGQVARILNPWMTSFIRYNPEPALEKVNCPVLALNGEKDLQVVPKENLAAINKALSKGGNKNSTVKELPGLNHMFQECSTGLPSEYSQIEQTISPLALRTVSEWIILKVN
ncbi:alpha/beta hydrolase family protein [Flavobacterium foetidum]|uniref:alpha/beta hydrolase family protein n=1 Tax=Flavobacterium foetidum TaxID=2026681 RepID=UPI001FC9CB95|nr:alpha/beta hydrolase [Flavobacterium foetidum]